MNDINGHKADFWLEIALYSETLELGFRNLENLNSIDIKLP